MVCVLMSYLCPIMSVLSQQSATVRSVVRKKAALCLLRLMRKTPADAQLISADTFAPVMSQLLEERDLGLLLSAVTLLLGICIRTTSGEEGLWTAQDSRVLCMGMWPVQDTCRQLHCFGRVAH